MSRFQRMAEEFSRSFGLDPMLLRDYGIPDEPSTVRPLLRAVDTPPTEASAVPGRVGGPAAPVTPGAAGIHPSQWPMDWDNIRRDLAHLRSVLTEALEWLDEIDPTPAGLAAVADVTNLDTKRR